MVAEILQPAKVWIYTRLILLTKILMSIMIFVTLFYPQAEQSRWEIMNQTDCGGFRYMISQRYKLTQVFTDWPIAALVYSLIC